jgi:thioredoxin reductase (NADPH)
VIERAGVGGQAGITERLDNFPGFPEGVSGAEFADRLRQQAERFGVEILAAQEVIGVGVDGDYRTVRAADGREYRSWAVLLAVGSTYRRLGIPGEDDFIGAGVHFCATCDGPFYRDQDVLVIGGGNSAGEEGIFLTKFARSVTLATRGPRLKASQIVVTKIRENPKMRALTSVTPVAFRGKGKLETVVLRETNATSATNATSTTTEADEASEASGAGGTGGTGGTTQETQDKLIELHPAGVFVFIGLTPNTKVVAGLVRLDEHGFITTDAALQTSVPGIFAAGDCRAGSTKQAASAAGEGAAVALGIRAYLNRFASGMAMNTAAEDSLQRSPSTPSSRGRE